MNHYRSVCLPALVTLACLALPFASAMAQPCGTFQQVPTPNPGTTGNSLGHLAALSDGTAWAVGSLSGPTTEPLLLYYDGTDWLEYPLPAEVEGIAFSSSGSTPDGDVWLAGTRAYTVYERELFFLRARDGAIDRIDRVLAAGAPIDLTATSSSDVWSLTATGSVIHFGGSAWIESAVPPAFQRLYPKGIHAAGTDDVWIVGYGGDGRGIYEGYVQHWDGSSWSSIPTPLDGQRQVYFRDIDGSAPDNLLIVGYFNFSATLSLHWDGGAWTEQTAPPSDAPLAEVAVLAPNDAWAAPYSQTADRTMFHWNGAAWSAVPGVDIPDALTVTWRSLSKAGPCDVWASGSYYIEPTHSTLVARLMPGTGSQVQVFVDDITVSRVKLGKKAFQGQAVVTVTDTDEAFVAGAEVTGHFSGPTTETLTATTATDGTVSFSSAVVGRTKVPWCFTVDHVVAAGAVYDPALDVETTDCQPARANSNGTETITLTVYPSPFNPATTFSFELPTQEFVSLEVYDLGGRRVATVVDGVMSAGRHTVGWDASHLASGVYLYRLESRGGSVSGRVTLLK